MGRLGHNSLSFFLYIHLGDIILELLIKKRKRNGAQGNIVITQVLAHIPFGKTNEKGIWGSFVFQLCLHEDNEDKSQIPNVFSYERIYWINRKSSISFKRMSLRAALWKGKEKSFCLDLTWLSG